MCGSNDIGYRASEKVSEWMVYHSDFKHLSQRLVLVIYQFSESGQQGISSCKRCYHCPCFGEVRRDKAAEDSFAHLALDAALHSGMAEKGTGIIGENGSKYYVSGCYWR